MSLSYATAFEDYSKTNAGDVQYDIQGQIVPLGELNKPYVQGNIEGRLDYYSGLGYASYSSSDENPAGTGDPLIPSTAPGLQPSVAPPSVGPRDSGPIVDPLKQAVDANAAGLKEMGQIDTSQADANNNVFGYDTLSSPYGNF